MGKSYNNFEDKTEIGSASIVLYDGVCALCHKTVRFLLKIDKQMKLRYAPLQGETAKAILERHKLPIKENESVLFVTGYETGEERVYYYSDSALQTLRALGGGWWLLSLLRLVPRFIRDSIYRFIAQRRYRWFGKYDSCDLPDADHQQRFLP